jgi:hypothetical protein
MSCYNPQCIGNYDFDKVAYYAKKRFVEGYDTLTLLTHAHTQREKEEIALVSTLDLDDEEIQVLQLSCRYAHECKAINCREKLKTIIEEELGTRIQ